MEYNTEGETTTLATVRRIGGSFVVTLPAPLVKAESLQEDEVIEIKVKKRRKSYFGALKGIGKFTKEDKFKGQLDE